MIPNLSQKANQTPAARYVKTGKVEAYNVGHYLRSLEANS
jgi:hypothetical protein